MPASGAAVIIVVGGITALTSLLGCVAAVRLWRALFGVVRRSVRCFVLFFVFFDSAMRIGLCTLYERLVGSPSVYRLLGTAAPVGDHRSCPGVRV